jgi:hypothetical protein
MSALENEDSSCGQCGRPVPYSSHSPWWCCEACEIAWRTARYGLTGIAVLPQLPPERPLSVDGYGAVVWDRLSWWPHPRRDAPKADHLNDVASGTEQAAS